MWLFTRGWALAQVTQRRLGASLSLGDELLAVTTIVVWKTNATGFRSIHIYNVSLKCWKTRLMISFSTILTCSPAQENVKARNGPVNDKHTRKRRKASQQSITTITQWMQTILYGKIIDNNYTMKTGKKHFKKKGRKRRTRRSWIEKENDRYNICTYILYNIRLNTYLCM